jgi:hypothetical protein
VEDFDEDPLDLLEDDGDGVIETILLLDEDAENHQQQPVKNSGCAVAFMVLTSSLLSAGLGLYRLFT